MNGRVYDYRLGRFLSVDPIISNPANSQSINPYSYIGNNPLSGTDPTGYDVCPAGQKGSDGGCQAPSKRNSMVEARKAGSIAGRAGDHVTVNGRDQDAKGSNATKPTGPKAQEQSGADGVGSKTADASDPSSFKGPGKATTDTAEVKGGDSPTSPQDKAPAPTTTPTGQRTYVTVTQSGGGGLLIFSGEGGTILALDPKTGIVYGYLYAAGGVGLGFGGAVSTQVGLLDMSNPQDITKWGLEVTAFAAAVHGASAQVSGTGPFGNGSAGFTGGYAAGGGAGVSGMVTYTWYQGSQKLSDLPEQVQTMFRSATRQ